MAEVTYKNLFKLVEEQISKRDQFRETKRFRNQLDRKDVAPLIGNPISDVRSTEIIDSVQELLNEALPGFIIEGLQVSETNPISNRVDITAGKGSKGGSLYTLPNDVSIIIPFDDETEVFYLSLFRDTILVEKRERSNALILAKVISPAPSIVNSKIYSNKAERVDEQQPYIQSFKEFKLFEDENGMLEETSLEKFRDNIGPILADNIIGNIKLSENLKITNTQGTLELDSNAIMLYNSSGGVTAKFNKDGTFYYNSSGIEIAKFATDSARIGNILITENSIQSDNFISESRGFKIEDSGYAEFENIRVRGRISSSVFEYDKVSAIGGKLYIGKATTLAFDMTALDSANLIAEDSQFSIGDILYIKDGTDEEYLEVTDNSSAPTYVVTRDLASAYSTNTNPTWTTATAVVSTGNAESGEIQGSIRLDAVSQYSPFIDITERQSSDYSDVSIKARYGNLEGISDPDFGGNLVGYGLYSENAYLKGCLHSSTICSTNIFGSTIEASSFQTSDGGKRLIFDSSGIVGYDDSCNERLSIGTDGRIIAHEMCLVDPNNSDIFSYLSGGLWFFKDAIGNLNPYVKRIDSGCVATAGTVTWPGWEFAPSILVGPQELQSYDSDFSTSCQKWCLYAETPEYYFNSGNDFGYCAVFHAELLKSSGIFAECIHDVEFDVSVLTNPSTCCTRVRMKFQLWAHDDSPTSCYCKGCINYKIRYRCCSCGVWCECNVVYEQDDSTLGNLKSDCSICTQISFGGDQGEFHIDATEVSIGWNPTVIPVSGLTECVRSFSASNVEVNGFETVGPICISDNDSGTTAIAGVNPSNVQCNILCWCEAPHDQIACSGTYVCSGTGRTITMAGISLIGQATPLWTLSSTYDTCNFTQINFTACGWSCKTTTNPAGVPACFQSGAGVTAGCLIQCYYPSVTTTTCETKKLYSTKDATGALEILDPNGVLNYIAISYG